jgi:hypothetical protein
VDWYSWHDGYDGPLGTRLAAVQEQLDAALACAAQGPVTIISMCAGQGHDVVGAVQRHDRRDDVRALLVELDERNVRAARERVAYATVAPADIALVCGVFGSLTDEDVDRTIGLLPTLLGRGAQVVWTAHRAAPGLWDTALGSFDRHGFVELHTNDRSEPYGVGRHRLEVEPRPFEPGSRMFRFADEETLVRLGRA